MTPKWIGEVLNDAKTNPNRKKQAGGEDRQEASPTVTEKRTRVKCVLAALRAELLRLHDCH